MPGVQLQAWLWTIPPCRQALPTTLQAPMRTQAAQQDVLCSSWQLATQKLWCCCNNTNASVPVPVLQLECSDVDLKEQKALRQSSRASCARNSCLPDCADALQRQLIVAMARAGESELVSTYCRQFHIDARTVPLRVEALQQAQSERRESFCQWSQPEANIHFVSTDEVSSILRASLPLSLPSGPWKCMEDIFITSLCHCCQPL